MEECAKWKTSGQILQARRVNLIGAGFQPLKNVMVLTVLQLGEGQEIHRWLQLEHFNHFIQTLLTKLKY